MDFSHPFVVVFVVFLVLWLIRPKNHTKSTEDTSFADPYTQALSSLVGAPQRPAIHPTMTVSVNDGGVVANNTMTSVSQIRGTGMFQGTQISHRERPSLQMLKPEDILAAAARPRTIPVPGLLKKNSNRQIRPEPVAAEGVDVLPAISSLKDIDFRDTYSAALSHAIGSGSVNY